MGSDLSVAVIRTEDTWPLGPWVVTPTASWRLGQQLEVGDGLRAVTHRGSDAIVSGVTTANNNDILALCADVVVVLQLRVEKGFRVHLCQDETHG